MSFRDGNQCRSEIGSLAISAARFALDDLGSTLETLDFVGAMTDTEAEVMVWRIEGRGDPVLRNLEAAPIDDEPSTPEEDVAAAAAYALVDGGAPTVALDDLRRELGQFCHDTSALEMPSRRRQFALHWRCNQPCKSQGFRVFGDAAGGLSPCATSTYRA